VFGQDLDLRYVWTCESIFGVPPGKIVGKTDAELLTPEAAKPIVELKRRVIESGRSERAQFPVAVGGRVALHDFYLEPLRDGQGTICGVSGVVTVLSSTIRAETDSGRAR
jgi:PAS domain-containing protein